MIPSQAKKVLAIIPARYQSSRFPGKPLVNIEGKSMIRRVYEQVSKAKLVQKVIVATDDSRIYREVESFGGMASMTRSDHLSGTDRCAEVAFQYPDFEMVVNVQGDEPFIQPEQIDLLVEVFQSHEHYEIGTMVKIIEDADKLSDPNTVKVVIDPKKIAVYFSRQAIPYIRGIHTKDWLKHHRFYKHIGMYIFRNATLQKLSTLTPTPLEQAEQLEQLRWLENQFSILTVETQQETLGIDTPEDLKKYLSKKL